MPPSQGRVLESEPLLQATEVLFGEVSAFLVLHFFLNFVCKLYSFQLNFHISKNIN